MSMTGRLEPYGVDEFFFRSRAGSFAFKITDISQRGAIKDCLSRRFIGLTSLTTLPKNDEQFFCLRIIFFMRTVHFGRFQVILSNAVREKLREKNFDVSDNAAVAKIFQFSDGVSNENCFAFLSTLPPPEEIIEVENERGREVAEPDKKVFQIEGQDCKLLVRLEGEGFDSRAIAYRVVFTSRENQNDRLALQLAYGNMEFSDEQSFVASRVRDILQESPNYINIWNEYANREGDFLLRRARAVGEISFLPKFNQTSDGIALTLIKDGKCDLSWLSAGDHLELREEPPSYFTDKEMTWQDYRAWKEQNSTLLKKRPPHFEITKITNDTLTLKSDKLFSSDGKLYFSIYGDEKQIETRTEARRRIQEGRSASPNLGLILGSKIEQLSQSFGLPAQNRQYIAPRSALLSQKIFRNEPTPRQIQAIDLALNTPDITIIQGPPGTGKTTVITAILERLNEISDKTKPQAGQVLITSLQHDAVENVIERIEINSLPTIKFGRRAHDEDQSPEIQLNQWCEKIRNALAEKHPTLRQTEEARQLFELFNHYMQAPSNSTALNFLNNARKFIREKNLLKEVDEIISQLQPLKTVDSDELLTKIYRLPTTESSFDDGGQEILIDLFNELEELFAPSPTPPQEIMLLTLRDAALAEQPDELNLNALRELKQELLARCIKPLIFEAQEARDDVTEIYEQLKRSLERPQDAAENIIYDLYRELRDNPQSVRQAVAAYNFAFAATAQQSDRKEIKVAKNVEKPWDDNVHAEYETVIVDEAARITPGDLMIPLSQASRRIILVGDQRQLPHIYDEEIFQALREDGQLENEGDIKTSMFEHLWKKAHELEQSDGIKRTVTLDAQYRMHPTLGNFVSRNFYEPYDESFRSPRPAEDFPQAICLSPVRWVHIPASRGKDLRSAGHSLYRTCEIDYIAKTLDEYLADPVNDKLTFGVISFYRAQAQAIKRKLKDFGTRVRIGTVDEFQGMEFDVIFLSVVRSGKNFSNVDFDFLENPPPVAYKEAFDEYKRRRDEIGGKIYGFLNVENRLCVALSRQKRLLIVVGDADMFRTGNAARTAKICVPAMFNLYKLCESEGSVVNA
ncbi:MAG: AAA family ATPase [Selenomonadaceae bacterium]|nr:AAA family ATPase [Selenomonadaceae bacterium]